MALQAGLDPTVGYQIMSDIQARQDQAQEERQAEEQRLLEEQRARRAARREQTMGLADMLMQGAASGLPLGASQAQLGALSGLPGVGPRAENTLSGLLQELYPDQGPRMTTEGLSPSIAVKGTLEEIGQANQARGRTVPAGPRTQSPLYVPPPPEPAEQPDLPDLSSVDTLPDQSGETEPVASMLARNVRTAMQVGDDLETATTNILSTMVRQGYPPELIEAARRQIAFMWSILGSASASSSPRAPSSPRPTGPALGGTGSGAR
jgi:hypothetical protein